MATKKAKTEALSQAAAKTSPAKKTVPTEAAEVDAETEAAEVDADAPKSTAERVRKMREERLRLGLRRLELYVHPDDWKEVKSLATKLRRKRAKAKAGG